MAEDKKVVTGAENVTWDLSAMYRGIDDPQIDKDVAILAKMAKKFQKNYSGKLEEKLGSAISDYEAINMLSYKIMVYLFLAQSTDVANAEIKAKRAEVGIKIGKISGDYLVFFDIEICAIDEKVIKKLYKNDPALAWHRPWIEETRKNKPHLLTKDVESALTKRASFGTNAWHTLYEELSADLEFTHGEKTYTLEEINSRLSESKDSNERFELMTILNEGLSGMYAKYSAQTLYMVTGKGAVENRERKYAHPMESRNKDNMVTDEVVDTLHRVVETVAGPLTQRFYRLKSAHLGLKTLRWSDRNAPMPFTDTTIVPYHEGQQIVCDSFRSFSPTLADIVDESINKRRIFAPAKKGGRTGAFNYSIVLPGRKAVSYCYLNYQGSNRDVKTMAHELGHLAHGILAGEKQGPLMSDAPIALCETASVFGEMTTYNKLRERLIKSGDAKSLLALIMSTIDDKVNTLVRQIGFSNFERRIHGIDPTYTTWNEPRKLSVEQLNSIWLETVRGMYGEEGEVFTYENMEHLWSYIPHFHNAFYVYGYAFGELLTSSLYAQYPTFGDAFEPMYLEALRAGSTKNVVELLKPFSLDPNDEQFWIHGVNVGLGALVEEAEKLSAEMGIIV